MMLTAHSGSDGTPENSKEFLTHMLSAGVDGVEVDVRRTVDGILYLSHDKPESMKDQLVLEEAFQIVASYPKGMINCDLKESNLELPVLELVDQYGLRDRLIFSGRVDLGKIASQELLEKVFFNVENIFPNVYLSGETEMERTGELIHFCEDKGIQTININHYLVTKTFVERLYAAGIGISVWTVDDFKKIDRFRELGVRNVTTRQTLAYRNRNLQKEATK